MVDGEKLKSWKAEHLYRLSVDLNREKDADIIERLEELPNKSEYVKRLIRRDLVSASE